MQDDKIIEVLQSNNYNIGNNMDRKEDGKKRSEMSFSKWLKIDLHIHSPKSNETKGNDYRNEEHNKDIDIYINDLSKKVNREELGIISITDHNIIDFDLYKKLLNNMTFKDVGIVVGMEINFEDEIVPINKFHALLILNIEVIDKIEKFYDNFLSLKGEIDKDTTWTLAEVYEAMYRASIEEYIFVPHYNNKGQGLSNKDLVHLDNLYCPLAIFGAFEDGPNPEKLQVSFKKYMNSNINKLPVVAFSDSHDITELDKVSTTSILGNCGSAFNSIKIAFSDPELRVSTFEVIDNNILKRSSKVEHKHISSININGIKIPLSPYQNTIIGGFGSGKTFLKSLMISGQDELEAKYSKYSEVIQEFSLVDNTEASHNKINNNPNISCISFEQNSEIFFKNTLTKEIKETFEKNFNLKFPQLDTLTFSEFDSNYYSNIKLAIDNINVTRGQDIEFSMLKNDDKTFEFDRPNNELNNVLSDEDLNNYITEIQNFRDTKIFMEENLFTNEKQKKITDSISTIETVSKSTRFEYDKIKIKIDNIDSLLAGYMDKVHESNGNRLSQIQKMDTIMNNIQSVISATTELRKNIKQVEKTVKDFKVNSEKKEVEEIEINSEIKYVLECKYKIDKLITDNYDYADILSKNYRGKNLYKGILLTKLANDTFHKKRDLSKAIEELINTYLKDNFSTFIYDLKIKGENDIESLFSNSPGERANKILELIFDLIEKMPDQKMNLLVLDQPEDNLDNRNIYKEVVQGIRNLKIRNKSLQMIFVSHNPNITIAADSENIIIAKKEGDFFTYTAGCLEQLNHSNEICDIIEGGKEALQERGIKLGVTYKRRRWS